MRICLTPADRSLCRVGPLAWYPNRDSLPYIDLYGLQEADSFIRTTLRHPIFAGLEPYRQGRIDG